MGGADVKALNPRTGEPEYDFAETTRTEIAAEAARLRVMQTGWEALGPEGRAAVLLRLADAMEAAAGGIAAALAVDTGRRTIAAIEVQGCIADAPW
jgi:acyl-CoA reductase-like NAD-dependent aldehyde dehydrogenase